MLDKNHPGHQLDLHVFIRLRVCCGGQPLPDPDVPRERNRLELPDDERTHHNMAVGSSTSRVRTRGVLLAQQKAPRPYEYCMASLPGRCSTCLIPSRPCPR